MDESTRGEFFATLRETPRQFRVFSKHIAAEVFQLGRRAA
jgi:hypothetical protein